MKSVKKMSIEKLQEKEKSSGEQLVIDWKTILKTLLEQGCVKWPMD
jgi:hypothetical protein